MGIGMVCVREVKWYPEEKGRKHAQSLISCKFPWVRSGDSPCSLTGIYWTYVKPWLTWSRKSARLGGLCSSSFGEAWLERPQRCITFGCLAPPLPSPHTCGDGYTWGSEHQGHCQENLSLVISLTGSSRSTTVTQAEGLGILSSVKSRTHVLFLPLANSNRSPRAVCYPQR